MIARLICWLRGHHYVWTGMLTIEGLSIPVGHCSRCGLEDD